MMLSFHRRGPRPDWTAADYDSYETLAAAGVRRPATRVTRARAPHPVRRAVRTVLRKILTSRTTPPPTARVRRRPAS